MWCETDDALRRLAQNNFNAAIVEGMREPAVVERLTGLGFEPAGQPGDYEEVTGNPDLWHPWRGMNVTMAYAGRGLTYYDQKETPGLGSEISNPKWQALWHGRKAYDAGWEPQLKVIKGKVGRIMEIDNYDLLVRVELLDEVSSLWEKLNELQ